MRETSIETLKRLERTIAKQEAELAALRSAIADVRAIVAKHAHCNEFRDRCDMRPIADRLASLPPVAGGGE